MYEKEQPKDDSADPVFNWCLSRQFLDILTRQAEEYINDPYWRNYWDVTSRNLIPVDIVDRVR